MRLTISLSLLALILFACSDDQNANQPEKVQKKTKTISKEALNSQIILLNDSLKNLSISRFMMDEKL
ncbi:hypothetical protein N9H88_00075 [bacterium]|nr:hypothetical protein [bacterium]